MKESQYSKLAKWITLVHELHEGQPTGIWPSVQQFIGEVIAPAYE